MQEGETRGLSAEVEYDCDGEYVNRRVLKLT